MSDLALKAISHVLRVIGDDPDVYAHLGPYTESFDLLTMAHDELTGREPGTARREIKEHVNALKALEARP